MKFQVIGLQRSGTSWVGAMVGCNFKMPQHSVSSHLKHLTVDEFDAAVAKKGRKYTPIANTISHFKHLFPDGAALLVEKRVGDWLWSIDRYDADMRKKRSQLLFNGVYDHAKAAAFHQRYYSDWVERLTIAEVPFEHVWYHDVLGDPVAWLRSFGERYGLEQINSHGRKGYFNLAGEKRWDASRRSRYLSGTKWECGDGSSASQIPRG